MHHLDIHLVKATLQDYPTIQNMGRLYVYDMSEFMQDDPEWIMPENGLYDCIDLKKYWLEAESFPYLVRKGNELAGFVIVDKKGSDKTVDFNMAQFFILRKFKHQAIGKQVAIQCFKFYPGVWEVMVMSKNKGAYGFWQKVLQEYTQGNFSEYQRNVVHWNSTPKNIFRFGT